MTEQAARYEYAPNKFGARPLDCDCRKWTHFVEPGKAICVKCEMEKAQMEADTLKVLVKEFREARNAARAELKEAYQTITDLMEAHENALVELRAERNEARELAQAMAQEAELLRDKITEWEAHYKV
jgi:uncharacterized coiled-coil DUF342 family protein